MVTFDLLIFTLGTVEGPPIPITIDMVKKAISQMKAGKAPGPSGIVVEMI